MKRRDFIKIITGSAATWSVAAHAQQGDRVRRIGAITSLSSNDPEGQARYAAFLQELQVLGWSVGRNIQIEYFWGEGNRDRSRKNATELVALAPDVILATGSPTLEPLLQATHTVPIVFVQIADPVGAGYVDAAAA
jgi:putative tryptophan/tyrosine transport system substrate-binding protein